MTAQTPNPFLVSSAAIKSAADTLRGIDRESLSEGEQKKFDDLQSRTDALCANVAKGANRVKDGAELAAQLTLRPQLFQKSVAAMHSAADSLRSIDRGPMSPAARKQLDDLETRTRGLAGDVAMGAHRLRPPPVEQTKPTLTVLPKVRTSSRHLDRAADVLRSIDRATLPAAARKKIDALETQTRTLSREVGVAALRRKAPGAKGD